MKTPPAKPASSIPFVVVELANPQRFVKVMRTGLRVECMGHEAMLWQELQRQLKENQQLREQAALLQMTVNEMKNDLGED